MPLPPRLKFKQGYSPSTVPLKADFDALKQDPKVALVFTVSTDGTINSYYTDNLGHVPKNRTLDDEYPLNGLYDSATMVVISYKVGTDTQIGYWKYTSSGRIMIS